MGIARLRIKAKSLGASDFGLSQAKNKKYYVVYNNKKINFGDKRYEDYTQHKDVLRRTRFWSRHSKIKDDQGRRVINDKNSPSYWSARLLWS
jgi:hypothetical protein